MRPIEASPLFLKSRVKLFHQVPVKETLGYVRLFKEEKEFYWPIKCCVERMSKAARSFFTSDVHWLTILKWHLASGRYKASGRGKNILSNRLNSIYTDGVQYQAATNILRNFKVKPVMDSEPIILKSDRKASEAKLLSKKIGKETGLEVTITPRIRG